VAHVYGPGRSQIATSRVTLLAMTTSQSSGSP
jgi:hypothetical protein